jgi:hypothetical protein
VRVNISFKEAFKEALKSKGLMLLAGLMALIIWGGTVLLVLIFPGAFENSYLGLITFLLPFFLPVIIAAITALIRIL